MNDQQPLYQKYNIARVDGQPVDSARCFVIELDRDPQAIEILDALRQIYSETRPKLAESLWLVQEELTKQKVSK